jgi:enoyl-CoA hydratase
MAGVRVELDGAVGVCRIDDPATRNALSPALLEGLIEALEGLAADDAVRCIAIVGTQDVFATGADPRTLAEAAPADAVAAGFWRRFGAIEVPIVSGTSGWALGTGFELAVASDLLVASKHTQFAQPEVSLGLIPGGGATQRLTRAIGRHRAMELILTARWMNAEEAYRAGIVNRVADRKRWLEDTLALAADVAARAPVATRLAKRAIRAADEPEVERGLALERQLLAEAMATEDRIEGVNAFLEGREPRFEGR